MTTEAPRWEEGDESGGPAASNSSHGLSESPSLDTARAGGVGDVKTVLRRLGPVGPLAVVAASLPAIGGFVLLGSVAWSAPWLRSHGEIGLVVYVLGFAVLAGLALLPTYAQAFLAGWAFGLGVGTTAALAGIGGAASIGYLIARRASGDRVVRLIEEQPKWKAVYDALIGGGAGKVLVIVTLLRVPPNSPFAITNLVLAACRVRPLTYLMGTLLGIAPRTAAAVFIGATGSELDFSQSSQTWFFVGGIVVTLMVVAVIGVMANRAIARVTGTDSASQARAASGADQSET